MDRLRLLARLQHQERCEEQLVPRGTWIDTSPNESLFYLYVSTTPSRSTAYLYQKDELAQDFNLRKVMYWEFQRGQRSYTRHEKELYSLIRAMTSFHYDVYLSSTYIYVKKDTFETLNIIWRTNTLVAKWLRSLNVFDYTVTHTALPGAVLNWENRGSSPSSFV